MGWAGGQRRPQRTASMGGGRHARLVGHRPFIGAVRAGRRCTICGQKR